MSPSNMKEQLARIYGAGIVAFSVIFGIITILGLTLKYIKLD